MAFTQVRPPPPLRDSIETIWDWHVAPGEWRLDRILPTPGAALVINLHEDETRVYADDGARACERTEGFAINGQTTRSFIIDTAEQIAVMGVIFKPGAAARFLREPLDRLADRHVAFSDLAGDGVRALRERLVNTGTAALRIALVERWLCARFDADALHPAVAFALRSLARAPQAARVDRLVVESGLSARRFGDLFRTQVGIGAKRYARLLRFRGVVAQVQRGIAVDWAHVALDCGFHDQPHLVREFRAFAGMTPSAYAAASGPDVNHIALP